MTEEFCSGWTCLPVITCSRLLQSHLLHQPRSSERGSRQPLHWPISHFYNEQHGSARTGIDHSNTDSTQQKQLTQGSEV
ncbi:hypothetical protein Cadr_000018968 [Camelus dromedarius]|uniref:Uncharacterized protein n=1 Tax=Camelus dromedarius TaxID=9838 RepID=A0A5N4D3Y6_CAMDR|nr:hypothetical protein Cadr_000018968 [Camelus dromedarius]